MEDDEGQSQEAPTKTTTTEERVQWHCCDFGWLIFTWPGRFKSVEFITTFLGFILIASLNIFDEEPRYEFYVFVGVFSWIMICVHMLLGIVHIMEKLPAVVTQPLVFLVLSFIAVLSWLIASSLLVSKSHGNSTVGAGAAFGYISMFLFAFEAIYYFVNWKRGIHLVSKSTTTTAANKEMQDTAGGAEVDESFPTY